MRVLALRPRSSSAAEGPARLVDLDTLLAESDVIILHLPLTAETHHFVDAAFLARVRPGTLLVNVSRGPLVDTSALLYALENGPLAAAALDVVEDEPHPPRELVQRPDVIFTPHVGFSSDASVTELRRRSTEEVVRVLAGEPPAHPCNQPSAVRV
jgi:D-3-phosphoglycerate dehydrogenase